MACTAVKRRSVKRRSILHYVLLATNNYEGIMFFVTCVRVWPVSVYPVMSMRMCALGKRLHCAEPVALDPAVAGALWRKFPNLPFSASGIRRTHKSHTHR